MIVIVRVLAVDERRNRRLLQELRCPDVRTAVAAIRSYPHAAGIVYEMELYADMPGDE